MNQLVESNGLFRLSRDRFGAMLAGTRRSQQRIAKSTTTKNSDESSAMTTVLGVLYVALLIEVMLVFLT